MRRVPADNDDGKGNLVARPMGDSWPRTVFVARIATRHLRNDHVARCEHAYDGVMLGGCAQHPGAGLRCPRCVAEHCFGHFELPACVECGRITVVAPVPIVVDLTPTEPAVITGLWWCRSCASQLEAA